MRVPSVAIFTVAVFVRGSSPVSHDYTRPAAAAFFFHIREVAVKTPMFNVIMCAFAGMVNVSVITDNRGFLTNGTAAVVCFGVSAFLFWKYCQTRP